ncbi:MAG: response regulator [Phormidesmis sp.]
MRILLVDDDEDLMESLAERLIQQRYAVDIAVDGSSAKTYVDLFDYDLIVLDLMLPDGDGIQFCRTFRAEGYNNPLMILTAKESTAQKVEALDAGADDYVIKPFDFDELCARIRALLRREHQGLPTVLSLGPLRLDPSACETTYNNNPVRLTPKEFSMMELFLRHPHRVYSLGAIIDDLWSFEDPPGEDAVRTHIKGLRRKLKAAGAPKDLIKTVYGLGYRLNENTAGSTAAAADKQPVRSQDAMAEPLNSDLNSDGGAFSGENRTASVSTPSEASSSQQAVNLSPIPSAATDSSLPDTDNLAHQAKLSEQLVQACRRYLSTASRHVAILEKVAAVLPSIFPNAFHNGRSISGAYSVLLDEGRVCAHKLAGSLGSFGIAEGSQIARKIEISLEEKLLQAGPSAPKATAKSTTKGITKVTAETSGEHTAEHTATETMQFSRLVSALRSRIDQATVQAATEALAASMHEGLPVVLIVSEDGSLAQSLIGCAAQVDLRTQVVATVQQAISVLGLAVCDLIVIDIPAAMGDGLLAFVQTIKKSYDLPIVVLREQLTLDQRLDFVQQGIEIVTHRNALPLQIMTAAAGLIRARVSKIKVAIADDDPDILALLHTSLEPWGFQVTTFECASSLWEWLADESDSSPASKVDILVLDVEMPEMSGLDLCQILRADARFQSIPILFLTHHQEESLRIQAYQLGADDFIHKAVAPTELATRLRNQLTRACLASQPS